MLWLFFPSPFPPISTCYQPCCVFVSRDEWRWKTHLMRVPEVPGVGDDFLTLVNPHGGWVPGVGATLLGLSACFGWSQRWLPCASLSTWSVFPSPLEQSLACVVSYVCIPCCAVETSCPSVVTGSSLDRFCQSMCVLPVAHGAP